MTAPRMTTKGRKILTEAIRYLEAGILPIALPGLRVELYRLSADKAGDLAKQAIKLKQKRLQVKKLVK